MKNLVLAAAILGAATIATGCGSTGTVTATWQLQDWSESSGAAIPAAGCPNGGDTVIVYSLPAGETDPTFATKDLFNCAVSGSGTTGALSTGDYTEWVEVTDHSGAVLYAQSTSQPVTVVGGGNSPVSFAFQANRGQIAASWSLVDNTGAPTGCTGVGGIETEAMVGSNLPISDQFDCAAGMGTGNPVPIGTYQFSLQAIDTSNPPQGLGPASAPKTADVQFGNQLVNAGSFVVQIGF